MPKYDSNFTQTVSKLLDTIRSLVAEDKQKMQSYLTVSRSNSVRFIQPYKKSALRIGQR